MKFRNLVAIPLVALFIFVGANDPQPNTKKEEVIVDAILAGLNRWHFDPQELDDDFSERVYDLYLKRLDGGKRFFTQSDIEKLSAFQTEIDDETRKGSYAFLDLSSQLLEQRLEQIKEYYQEILSQPFDFTASETFESDADKRGFAGSDEELKALWKASLKYQTMIRLIDLKKANEEKEKEARKPEAELEKQARERILKIHNDWFHRMERLDRDDHLSDYLNAMTAAYDPHTNYMPPKDKADFDIGMSGRLEGIGARLTEDGVYIKVTDVVPGGPSWKQGDLETNDLILGVAQEEDDFVDVVDMPVDEAVKMIRGKKGTKVRLKVKKVDGSVKEINIIRDVVILDESYAKSSIITDEEFPGVKIGFIHLPKFYADFSGKGGRSCAEDVKKEITKLKNEGIDGIILDLRFNGGGSLRDVVDMGGLFIDEGPIVQVKSRGRRPYILKDTDDGVHYDGPLVILVNQYSASASEILAAAMQDYNRAVIVGSSSTFGKGTVQRFLDLDDMVPSDLKEIKPLGAVKLTIQKFYRIDGSTTQLQGVQPDIVLPDSYSLIEIGEKEEDYPMKWDEISPAEYEETDALKKLDKIKRNSAKRIEKSEAFDMMEQKAAFYKERRDQSILQLNLAEYQANEARLEARNEEFKDLTKAIPGISVTSLDADKEEIEANERRKASITDWHKAIKKDLQIDEAIAIINDLKN